MIEGTIGFTTSTIRTLKFPVAFSDVLRRELRPQGIQVVVVQPSAIKTKAYGQWEAALNGKSLVVEACRFTTLNMSRTVEDRSG